MNTHKHDETLNEDGGKKFERPETDDIVENYTKPMDKGELKHKD